MRAIGNRPGFEFFTRAHRAFIDAALRSFVSVPLISAEAIPASAAERMRRYRKRQKRGPDCPDQIGLAEIEGLIERGYLSRGDKENVKVVEFATNDFLSEALLGL